MNNNTALEWIPAQHVFLKKITIHAPVAAVWHHLTTPALMQRWMLDNSMEADIITDWTVGGPFTMQGKLHGITFKNTGKVLLFEPEKTLLYTHLSSLSTLPDLPASYSHLRFDLTPSGQGTLLALTISNAPTETIFKHLAFYWNTTMDIIHKIIVPG
jgi:uncharacterized protein YndB with AHSA1/START domain